MAKRQKKDISKIERLEAELCKKIEHERSKGKLATEDDLRGFMPKVSHIRIDTRQVWLSFPNKSSDLHLTC